MSKTLKASAFIAAVLFSSAAFSSPLPELINSHTSRAQERIGVVSISGISGSSDNAVKKLQEKAQALGGTKIQVISMGTPGDSSHWMGNAIVYK